MESRVSYTAVGVFVLLLGALSVAAIFYLTEGVTRKVYETYLVYALDSVTGLNPNASVKFRGVDVGHVSRIELDRAHPERVRLYLSIEEGVPITRDTVARLQMQGITGLLIVDLAASGPDVTPLVADPGQEYPVIAYEHTLLSKLDDGISGALVTMNNLGDRLEKLFSEENIRHLDRTLRNVATLTDSLADHREDLVAFVEAGRATAENTAAMTARAGELIARTESLIADGRDAAQALTQVAQRANQTLLRVESASQSAREAGESATRLSESGQQTLELVRRETLPEFEHLLVQVNDLSREMTLLVSELRDDPRRLITGGPHYPSGPGE
ncbi:MAG: MlaD family protein [Halothiobacillaceae bacterium]